ncbi:hypothetical protein L873DRAFT_1824437 [Choiromyces venosus 120613-1]|uniref:Uncharacterized protein n=1 Tax=Choiromyces venosus 120613-1 TaxID=1336337 RepID=A0A3N4IW88_9PEZI|nr:hypothetical protein L873DRAFT_1824437 [Choiromyces venosus 120613-1]
MLDQLASGVVAGKAARIPPSHPCIAATSISTNSIPMPVHNTHIPPWIIDRKESSSVPLDNCGFAITNIVRNSAKELTVHFSRRHGKAIRQNYMSMTFETVGADRSIR